MLEFDGLDEDRYERAELVSFRASLQEPSRSDDRRFVLTDSEGNRRPTTSNELLRPMYFAVSCLAFIVSCARLLDGSTLPNEQVLMTLVGSFLTYVLVVGGAWAWWRRNRARPLRPADFAATCRIEIDPQALSFTWRRSAAQTTLLRFPLTEVAQLEGRRRLVLVRRDRERVPLPCSVSRDEGYRFATRELATRCNELLGEARMLGGYRGELLEPTDSTEVRQRHG